MNTLGSIRAFYCLVIGLVAAFANTAQASEPKLNVLMIIVDDLAPVISAYGGPVATPSLDQLAARGTRFTSNYSNAPVCGASRASLLSGLAPTSSRFLSYDSRLDSEVQNAISLPAYFRQQGWYTVANGKVFDSIADSAASWSEPVWSPGDDWFGKEPDGRGEHLQAAYIEPPGWGRLPHAEKLQVADTDYPDGQVAVKAVADLQRLAQNDAPFFMAVGFRKPHLPFNAPEQYWQPVGTPDEMLPATWRAPTKDIPVAARHRSLELRSQYDALPLFGDPSVTAASEIVAGYYAAVRYADAQVGLVLKGLENSGAADNTLVVVLGDHGFLLGDQRMWTKHALFEPALRTPLIISHPDFPGGQHARSVTDLLDVFPTLVDLAGLAIPAHVEGVSVRSLMVEPTLAERGDKKGSISRWMNGESIRHGNYRYTRWFDEGGQTTGEMLFDLTSDPFEQDNVAARSEMAAVIAELTSYLEDRRAGPVWSEALDTQYGRWSLASSFIGGVLLLGLIYPVPALVAVLLLFSILMILFFRYRRRLGRSTLRSTGLK